MMGGWIAFLLLPPVLLLDGHLHTCVVEGVRDGREEQVVGELLDLYELANK